MKGGVGGGVRRCPTVVCWLSGPSFSSICCAEFLCLLVCAHTWHICGEDGWAHQAGVQQPPSGVPTLIFILPYLTLQVLSAKN